MNPAEETHLHLELKVLVLPLPAEDVARNANFNGLLKVVGARPGRATDQVLHRKSAGRERREDGRREEDDRTRVKCWLSDRWESIHEHDWEAFLMINK